MSVPAQTLAATAKSAATLGFVPVAIHFDLFTALTILDKPSTGSDVLKASKNCSQSNLLLVQDTLLAMAGIGFIDLVEEDLFSPNAITKHLAETPSASHGALHFTTEALFASAFLIRKLQATNFAYPFKEGETPMQYAYKAIGEEALSQEHTYSIMEHEGRMDSFNTFMVGKFFKTQKLPDRLEALGYDLGAVIKEKQPTSISVVDIGGGRGELLLEIKDAFPELQPESSVVQEFNSAIGTIPSITLSEWNYKEQDSPQPIRGAKIYSLSHILHNLPDIDAAQLLEKK